MEDLEYPPMLPIIVVIGIIFLSVCVGVITYPIANEISQNMRDNTIYLGDEVATTDEYNILFNDSFSGNVVTTMRDKMYIVRNTNGEERTFERKWIDKTSAGGDI